MYAMPVSIAEYPSTCCMYSVSIRNIENRAVPRMNPAMFAPATVLILKIEKDMSGSFARVSRSTKPASSSAAATKMLIVFAELQP